MRVWLLKAGEPVWSDGANVRLHRTGTLAEYLADQGHEVVWWTSTFYHPRKINRFDHDAVSSHGDRIAIRFLHSPGYEKNVSVGRLRDHRVLGQKFAQLAPHEPEPDVVLTAFPTIELSSEAVRYGKERGIPVVTDVRDLWPDTFVDVLPPAIRRIAKLVIRPLVRQTRDALRDSTAIVAMSEGCLDWGLARADRARGPWDRLFPLGYRKPVAAPEEISTARHDLIESGVRPDAVICWFLGTFGRMSDVGTVIEAARLMATGRDTKVQFVLSGDGDFRDRWTALAGGLPNVVFTGWIEGAGILAMMEMAAVGVVAIDTIPEALPNKLLEYFSGGLPVVSSLEGDAAALVVDEGVGINYGSKDPADLVRAIDHLVATPDVRRAMSARAQSLYERRFQSDVVYSAMARYLSKIADRGSDVPTTPGPPPG